MDRKRRDAAGSSFDVFLCHNTEDKPEVRLVAEALESSGIKVWFDERELRPGTVWQEFLEQQIGSIGAAAVFVGKSGIGPWQNRELRAFLNQFVRRGCTVIPVVLSSAKERPDLPIFLQDFHWVDFRQSNPVPLKQLIWGITGNKPDTRLPRAPTDAEPEPERPAVLWQSSALPQDRDQEARKREFLAFLGRWRSEIERINPVHREAVLRAYECRIHEFHALRAKVRGDFTDPRFDKAANTLGSIRREDILNARAGADARDVVCTQLDILKDCQ